MTDDKKPYTHVIRSFEVQFYLPDPHVVQSPPRDGSSRLDRLTIAETLNAVAAKIVELTQEQPPK